MILKDYGIATALARRFQKQRLPRALNIKTRVQHGDRLTDADIVFLRQACNDVRALMPSIARYPECRHLAVQAADLYREITELALANEQSR